LDDVTGDGTQDVVVSVRAAYAFTGPASGTRALGDADVTVTHGGSVFANVGLAVASGDLRGDGSVTLARGDAWATRTSCRARRAGTTAARSRGTAGARSSRA
jgi:hypothetical protein